MKHPDRKFLTGHAKALVLGLVGGALFYTTGMPLAWMLGAMIFVAVGALAGMAPAIAPGLRGVMIAVLGVFLGSAFSPDVLNNLAQWGAGLAVLMVYVVISSAVVYAYLRFVAGFDPVTAYFSSTPGGLGEMVVSAEAMGGDVRRVSLVHTTRVLSIVILVPFYYRLVVGLDVPSVMPDTGTSNGTLVDWLLLAGSAVVGWPLAKFLRLPAAAIVGPMLLSMIIHLTGLTSMTPPPMLVACAQLVVGAAVGARFGGTELKFVFRIMGTAFITTLILLSLSVATTWAVADLAGIRPEALILTLAPGGLAEMALIALALGIDTAFVSSMHVFRIALIVIIAPLTFRVIRGRTTDT